MSTTTTAANALVTATVSRHGTTDATTNRTSIYNDSVDATLGAASYQIATTPGSYSDTYTGSASADSYAPHSERDQMLGLEACASRVQA